MLIICKIIKIVNIIPEINVFSVYNKKYTTGPKKVTSLISLCNTNMLCLLF